MNKPVSFAVIGCGHIGKRHIALIQSMEGVSLKAICDTNPAIALLADSCGVPFFLSCESLLASGIPFDVLSIATPNGFHVTHATQGLNAGKHVIIEKPLALTVSEGNAIRQAAIRNDKQVFCVMQNRYSPTAIWLKSLLENQILGEIYFIQVNCFWNRDDRYYTPDSWHGKKGIDGGPLFTQFSHFADILYWLFGEIEEINPRFFNFNHQHNTEYEDSGIIHFTFREKKGAGSFQYSTSLWDTNMESSITIIGQKGSVKVGGQYMNKIEYAHIQDYTPPILPEAALPNDYGGYKGSAANHLYIFENVLAVLKKNAAIDIPIEEGIAVIKMIEDIYSFKNQ